MSETRKTDYTMVVVTVLLVKVDSLVAEHFLESLYGAKSMELIAALN